MSASPSSKLCVRKHLIEAVREAKVTQARTHPHLCRGLMNAMARQRGSRRPHLAPGLQSGKLADFNLEPQAGGVGSQATTIWRSTITLSLLKRRLFSFKS